jgi:tetratricopeptide (TPR) repeat protein
VKKQKEAIIPSFKRGDFQKVRGYIDQLIESQLRFGDRSYAAMSLCDLAQHAKTVSNHSLQLELAKRAAEIFPDDGWTHGQVADAYFCLGQYDNAAQSFKEAAFFGKASFARAGQARILRGQGKFAEALELYDRSINDFPGEVTLWNGRAEVFREMWKLDEALKAYESTVEKFPLEAVPRCGRAAVLKDLGRLDEALDAYTRTCELFGGDIVPRNGRADVLKEMGRLKDALTAYRETADAFPEDAVSRCGLAEVLRDTGQLEDALRLYMETIAAFPYVSVAYCGCAETLRDMNRLDTALASYDKALTKFPNDEFVRNSRANILKLLGKPEAALQAYDETIRSFPYDIFARSGRADLLKTLGRIPEALEAYDYLIERNPSGQNFWHAKAAILVVLGEYAKAEEMLPSKSPETRDDWIAYHVRGMILLKSNKLDAAVVHFETGLNSIPFARQRKYFQNALAIARLRRGEYAKATETLISAEEPMAEILKIHAFGELRQSDLAKRSLARLELVCPVTLIPLRDELAARYQLRQQPPRHEDPWIFDEECRVALLNAA